MSGPPDGFFEWLAGEFTRRFGGPADPPLVVEIGHGGSRRRYFRVGRPSRSLVGLFSPDPPADDRGVTENESFLYVAAHLAAAGVPVPAIHAVSLSDGWFVLADAGETLLYDEFRRQGHSGDLRRMYGRAVRELARIHARATPGFEPRRTHNADWDPAFARTFESGYFQRAFLRGLLGWDPAPLDGDLDRLAEDLAPLWEPYFLYRDFQSQNITVGEAGLCFLDFQGARHGPRQYDLASLLWDPYVELPTEWLEPLTAEYAAETAGLDPAFDRDGFTAGFALVAVHRLMQALGAYGFLSTTAGKPHFRAHIPAAVRQLARLAGRSPALTAYPALLGCIRRLEEAMPARSEVSS